MYYSPITMPLQQIIIDERNASAGYARLHFVSFVVFAAKTAARLRTYFYVPPKLAYLRYASKLQTVRQLHQGWRGVTLQRHLNEGAAG